MRGLDRLNYLLRLILSANGHRVGALKWQDMQAQIQYGGVIGAAKDLTLKDDRTFLSDFAHRIQMLTAAANQQRWEKMQSKFKQMDTEWQAQQGRNRLVSSCKITSPDPNDKNNRAAVDHYLLRILRLRFRYLIRRASMRWPPSQLKAA